MNVLFNFKNGELVKSKYLKSMYIIHIKSYVLPLLRNTGISFEIHLSFKRSCIIERPSHLTKHSYVVKKKKLCQIFSNIDLFEGKCPQP